MLWPLGSFDQLTPLLPMDSKELNLQVKWLQAMLDATTMDPTLNLGGGEVRSGP
jgi:hypothetical protein